MKPRLIHPVDVTIERVDQAATSWDPDFREPAQPADPAQVGSVTYKPAEQIRAQVRFGNYERREMELGGDSPRTSGSIVYEKAKTASLKKGDRITAVAGDPVELYVIEVAPVAASRSRFHLERATFEDRRRGGDGR